MNQLQQPIKDNIVSTGIMGLDIALGIGGIKKGSIVEIYGPESGGKTTLALQMCKQYTSYRFNPAHIQPYRSIIF